MWGTGVPANRAKKRRDEASNSFALFLIMSPVIFGAFGMGLDLSRNTYIKTSLQNDMDMAVVAGAAVTKVDSAGKVAIDTGSGPTNNPALATVKKMYAVNRAVGPGLQCTGPGTPIPGTFERQCWQEVSWTIASTQTGPKSPARVQYTAKETSLNAFLPIIGIKWQHYIITSQARLAQDTK